MTGFFGGGLLAVNSATGERFAGTWESHVTNAQAMLVNSNKTLIQLEIQVHDGSLPHGTGQGIDSQGKHYTLQF